jgi:hypothetical protein
LPSTTLTNMVGQVPQVCLQIFNLQTGLCRQACQQ